MKRLVLWLILGAAITVAAPGLWAQENNGEKGGESAGLKAWEWANFAVLAGALGYVIYKNAGPAFEVRGRRIRKDMVEAEEIKKDAEARAAAVEQRLARLGEEISALRSEAKREEEAGNARYSRQTAAEIEKIKAHAQQEIASAGKAAKMELKRYTAELALQMAEQQIRSRITGDTEDRLVRGFIRNIEGPKSSAGAS